MSKSKLILTDNGDNVVDVERLLHAWIPAEKPQSLTFLYPLKRQFSVHFSKNEEGRADVMALLDTLLEANPALGRIGNELINVSRVIYCWTATENGKPGMYVVFEGIPEGIRYFVATQSKDEAKEAVKGIVEHARTLDEGVIV